MRTKILALAVLLTTSMAASLAQARGSASGVMVLANAFIYNSTDEDNGTKVESKNSVYDIKLGYLTGSGLYLGGLYTIRNSESGGSSSDGKALGGSVGYVGANGFFVMGHYIASAELGDDLKEGTGIQGDLGYITNVTGAFVVGVELTYRSIEYKKADDSKYKKDELMPLLTVGFVF